MNAGRRDWYLANLGIVRYVPRDAVPDEDDQAERGDALSDAAHSAPPVAAQEDDTSGKTRQGRPRGLMADLAAPAKAPPAPSEPKQAPAEEPASPVVYFRLCFWQPAEDLAVLSALPEGERPGAEQVTMLTNLLRAIHRLPGPLPPVDLIDWPQIGPGRAQLSADLNAARQFLSVYLSAKNQLQPFRHVLLMGEMAVKATSDGEVADVGDQLPLACGATGIVTHSLYDMHRDPALKGPTWNAIKFLAEGAE
ncbi:MAG: hypothetical protein CMK32_04190 [Porticoccaceae bacterium]|nr:hypothetical protein [Porticoccaceae bacterium]